MAGIPEGKVLPFVDRVLVRLDEMPWAAGVRVTAGYLVVPAWLMFSGEGYSEWTVFPFLLAVLAGLRVVPAVLRKALPFGNTVLTAWAQRRQLAKRFDSYQWQKLLWIGFGLTFFVWRSGRHSVALLTLTSLCLASGAIGLVFWRHQATRLARMTVRPESAVKPGPGIDSKLRVEW
jgi:hypothetical protein